MTTNNTSNDEKPFICFFKCGISPDLELSREYKMKLKKKGTAAAATTTAPAAAAHPSVQELKPKQSVTIGATRSTRVSCADCLWEGTILVKTPGDVDEDTLSNSVLPVHICTHAHPSPLLVLFDIAFPLSF